MKRQPDSTCPVIHVRLRPKIHREAQKIAEKAEMALSHWVRDVVEAHLIQYHGK